MNVPALHQSSLPAQPAGLGAFAPLFDDPFGESRDGIERLLLLLHKIGVFNFRAKGVAHGEDLDGYGLFEGAEAADSFQRGGRATVPQDGPFVRNVLLQSGQSEVAIQDIGAIGSFDGKIASVISGSPLIPLFHFNVCGSSWNCDDILISRSAGRKNRYKTLSVPWVILLLSSSRRM